MCSLLPVRYSPCPQQHMGLHSWAGITPSFILGLSSHIPAESFRRVIIVHFLARNGTPQSQIRAQRMSGDLLLPPQIASLHYLYGSGLTARDCSVRYQDYVVT
jgi:hypothetical protein